MKKNKTIYILLIGVFLTQFVFSKYTEKRPIQYHHIYNDTREKLGLEPIQKEWEMNNSLKAVFQKWTPQKKGEEIGFYSKYVSCDSHFHKILKENDNYLIWNDSTQQILSVHYLYETKKYIFELRKPDADESLDLYGYSGKKIKDITKEEATSLMQKNIIEKNWP